MNKVSLISMNEWKTFPCVSSDFLPFEGTRHHSSRLNFSVSFKYCESAQSCLSLEEFVYHPKNALGILFTFSKWPNLRNSNFWTLQYIFFKLPPPSPPYIFYFLLLSLPHFIRPFLNCVRRSGLMLYCYEDEYVRIPFLLEFTNVWLWVYLNVLEDFGSSMKILLQNLWPSSILIQFNLTVSWSP